MAKGSVVLPGHHSRFSRYIADYFPEHFHVDVAFAYGSEEGVLIQIATPAGTVASCETTVVQALDIMAMGDIAELLKMRVGRS